VARFPESGWRHKDAKGAKIATEPALRTRREALDRTKDAKGANIATPPAWRTRHRA
jgi:hypothetical protein